MNRGVIYITRGNKPDIQKEFGVNSTINVNELFAKKQNELTPGHEIEDFYNMICEEIKEKLSGNIKGILIDFELNGYDAFAIAHHIRLSGSDIRELPIVITGSHMLSLEEIDLDHKAYYNLFRIKGGVSFVKSDRLFQPKDAFSSKTNLMFAIESLNNFNIDEYLSNLYIKQPDTTDRHQIANEWGAFKLAYEAGFDISYKLPPTLYFKYLKAKYGNVEKKKEEKTILDNKIKVLLIDDNAEKGWKEALEKVLPAKIDKKEEELKVILDNQLNFNPNDYEIIFLDIYLPKFEGKEVNKDTKSAIKILQKIKAENPAIPVIVFTASNKVWNLKKLIELGADGYFVKEAPENASIENFSKSNFKDFEETVKQVLNKQKILKPYWDNIELIKKNFLEEIIDETKTKFKSRIEERLNMFFGLLKRGFEQNKFNEEQFFFSDYELAFMTLWSILNETQEVYYQKVHKDEKLTIIDKDGNEVSEHPNGRKINPIPGYNWKIKNQNDYLIKRVFDFEYENNQIKTNKRDYYILKSKSKPLETKLYFEKGTPPYYEIVENSENSNITRELANQIAFLILMKNEFKNHVNRNKYLENLKELNDIRNHLYLTHGDNIGKGFYEKTEKQKRDINDYNINPEGDIKRLFELVGFLLTGKNIEVKFE